MSLQTSRNNDDYIEFVEQHPDSYDSIFEVLKVSEKGATLGDVSMRLNIPENILESCFDIIVSSWNSFFSKGRIIYNPENNKYYYLSPLDPRAMERYPKLTRSFIV